MSGGGKEEQIVIEDEKKPETTAMVTVDTSRSGGVYIPPFKLKQLQQQMDQNSKEYQRLMWDALKKSLNGLVNKVSVNNIRNLIPEVFQENILWGKGLFCRSVMKSQAAAPVHTNVLCALVAVVNTKIPEIGDLLLKRVLFNFKKSYKKRDKQMLLTYAKFIAHLINQRVAHEILGLKLLLRLLTDPTHDSVEVAVCFFKEAGKALETLAPQGFLIIQEQFRTILQEGSLDKRTQYIIEGLFAVIKKKFSDFPDVVEELDLVEEEEQMTHELDLDEDYDIKRNLEYFKHNPNFAEDMETYKELKVEILGDEDDEDEAASSEGWEAEQAEENQQQKVHDMTGEEVTALRKTIYLTLQSSKDHDEAAHKLCSGPCQDYTNGDHLAAMVVEACSMSKTFIRYHGLVAERFCLLNRNFQAAFEDEFSLQYQLSYNMETAKLRNTARLFAHILQCDALPWEVLKCIRLNENDTTSGSRIFIKILFLELAELMGLAKLCVRLNEPVLQAYVAGLLPRDNAKDTRFAINFFTAIGLGGLTDELREHLEKLPQQPLILPEESDSEDSDSTEDSSSSSDSSSSDSSDTDSSDSSDSSESESAPRKKRRTK